MAVEKLLLQIQRREIPMAVQAGLAHGHDAGMVQQGRDCSQSPAAASAAELG